MLLVNTVVTCFSVFFAPDWVTGVLAFACLFNAIVLGYFTFENRLIELGQRQRAEEAQQDQ